MMFGILTEGSAWLQCGRRKIALTSGSLWLVPHGAKHRVYSDPKAQTVPLEDLPVQPQSERYEILEYGGGGARSQVTYGVVRLDGAVAGKLVDSLPEVVQLDTAGKQTRDWLSQTVAFISQEARNPQAGGDVVLSRLADIIVIQAIREWVSNPANCRTGWLAALRDERLGRVLRALHASPGDDWTLERLAALAGMSRSVFAEKFRSFVGEPAMAYLTWLRMETAREQLRETDLPLATLAAELGYRSEAAFGRTFKRTTGSTPGRWRRVSRVDAP